MGCLGWEVNESKGNISQGPKDRENHTGGGWVFRQEHSWERAGGGTLFLDFVWSPVAFIMQRPGSLE